MTVVACSSMPMGICMWESASVREIWLLVVIVHYMHHSLINLDKWPSEQCLQRSKYHDTYFHRLVTALAPDINWKAPLSGRDQDQPRTGTKHSSRSGGLSPFPLPGKASLTGTQNLGTSY